MLVTGATGRLGRALMPRLVAAGMEVRCLVLPGDLAAESLSGLGVDVVEGDLNSDQALRAAAADVDAVIHMAAQLPGPGVSGRQLVDSIVSGTFNLLEAVVTFGSAETRLLYVSSSAVYGPQLPPEEVPIRETHSIRPTSVYGAAKAAAEGFVTAYTNSNDLRTSIIRPADIVEPQDFDLQRGFMGRRFEVDEENKSLRVPVDDQGESATMSFASATDTARGILAVMRSEEAIGETFHIGPKRSIPDLEVATVLARRRDLTLMTVPSEGPTRRWILASTKAEEMLGLVIEVELDDIVR